MTKHYITRTFDPYDHNQLLHFQTDLYREFGKFGVRWGASIATNTNDFASRARTIRYWFVNENDRLLFALKYMHD